MKLKLFKEADCEMKQFEDFNKAEFFYECQADSYPNRRGCMIPFGFRMLNAELPQYLGRSEESISHLYKLLHVVQGIIDSLGQNESELKLIQLDDKAN